MRTRTLFAVATGLAILAVAPALADTVAAPGRSAVTETSTSAAPERPAPASSSPTPRPSFRPPVHTAPDVPYQASCDEHGVAFDVVPNTSAARARAAEACSNLQRSAEDLGWR